VPSDDTGPSNEIGCLPWLPAPPASTAIGKQRRRPSKRHRQSIGASASSLHHKPCCFPFVKVPAASADVDTGSMVCRQHGHGGLPDALRGSGDSVPRCSLPRARLAGEHGGDRRGAISTSRCGGSCADASFHALWSFCAWTNAKTVDLIQAQAMGSVARQRRVSFSRRCAPTGSYRRTRAGRTSATPAVGAPTRALAAWVRC